MTTALLPEHMLNFIEAEVSSICMDVVKKVCDEYDLPFETVKQKLQKYINMEIETDNTEVFRIVTRRPRKKKAVGEAVCKAKMFDKEEKCVRQCTLERLDNCEFCKVHERMNKVGRLRFGTV